MPRGRALKNPNGYGSVVKLSGKRRNPFEVRVNTRMDERYYPIYDVLGRFPNREEALIALADYNKNPFSVPDRNITFAQLYEKFYKNKYELSGKTYSQSSMACTGFLTLVNRIIWQKPHNCGFFYVKFIKF